MNAQPMVQEDYEAFTKRLQEHHRVPGHKHKNRFSMSHSPTNVAIVRMSKQQSTRTLNIVAG